jgi:hypothetical protein
MNMNLRERIEEVKPGLKHNSSVGLTPLVSEMALPSIFEPLPNGDRPRLAIGEVS